VFQTFCFFFQKSHKKILPCRIFTICRYIFIMAAFLIYAIYTVSKSVNIPVDIPSHYHRLNNSTELHSNSSDSSVGFDVAFVFLIMTFATLGIIFDYFIFFIVIDSLYQKFKSGSRQQLPLV
jgi:hypothetical protein